MEIIESYGRLLFGEKVILDDTFVRIEHQAPEPAKAGEWHGSFRLPPRCLLGMGAYQLVLECGFSGIIYVETDYYDENQEILAAFQGSEKPNWQG